MKGSKHIFIFYAFFLLSFNSLKCQVAWSKCIGGIGNENCNDIIQLRDGHTISVGDKSSNPNIGQYNSDNGQDCFVVKQKPNGDTVWTKKFGGSLQDRAHSVYELNDCNILVCGYAYSSDGDVNLNKGASDAWAIKIDPDGNILWSKTFGGSSDEWFNGICQDSNNDIYIIGTTYSNNMDVFSNNGSSDFWLVKINNSGSLLFSKCFGGAGDERGTSIIRSKNNKLFLGGHTNSSNGICSTNHGANDILVVEVDFTGNFVWSRCFGGTNNEFSEQNSLTKISSNLFVIGGTSYSSNGNIGSNYGNTDYAVIKFDSLGTFISSYNYGGTDTDYCTSILKTPDNNVILMGQSGSTDINVNDHIGGIDFWLVKINISNGNIIYTKTIGTLDGDYGRKIINSFDYSYIVAGFSYANLCTNSPNSNGGKDFLIHKLALNFDSANDSIVNNHQSVNICQGDSVLIGVEYFTTSGLHYSVLSSTLTCDSIIFANVVLMPAPLVNIGNDTVMCNGQNLVLTTVNSNYSYLWSNGSTTNSISVSAPGIYSVTATLGQCSASDIINVTFAPIPTVNLGNDTIMCNGENLVLTAGTSSLSYQWSTGATSNSVVVNSPGSYSVIVISGQCNAVDFINVTYTATPFINLGNDTTVCEGQSLVLTGGPNVYNYTWSNGATTTSLLVSTAGSYSVKATSGYCSTNDLINVMYNLNPVINIGNDTSLCDEQSIVLTAGSNNYNYVWSNGATTNSIIANTAGIYSVTATLGQCVSSDLIELMYNANPALNIGNDTILCNGQNLILTAASNASNYLWFNGATTNSMAINSSGNYWINATEGKCMSTDVITVTFENCNTENFIPEIFTPNGDGMNDIFQITLLNAYDIHLHLYNRWGHELYTSDENSSTACSSISWDGKYRGEYLPAGTYFYLIEYQKLNGENSVIKGFVHLTR